MTTPIDPLDITPIDLLDTNASWPADTRVTLYTTGDYRRDDVWLRIMTPGSWQGAILTRDQATSLRDALDAWLAGGLTSITQLDQETP